MFTWNYRMLWLRDDGVKVERYWQSMIKHLMLCLISALLSFLHDIMRTSQHPFITAPVRQPARFFFLHSVYNVNIAVDCDYMYNKLYYEILYKNDNFPIIYSPSSHPNCIRLFSFRIRQLIKKLLFWIETMPLFKRNIYIDNVINAIVSNFRCLSAAHRQKDAVSPNDTDILFYFIRTKRFGKISFLSFPVKLLWNNVYCEKHYIHKIELNMS